MSRCQRRFCIGLVGGAVCYIAVTKLKSACKYDDSLDVFGVDGVGSTVGMLMPGFLASADVNSAIATTYTMNDQAVSLAGGMSQFMNRVKGVLLTIGLAVFGTFIILKLVDAIVGLRVAEEEETVGLDLSRHGKKAYND